MNFPLSIFISGLLIAGSTGKTSCQPNISSVDGSVPALQDEHKSLFHFAGNVTEKNKLPFAVVEGSKPAWSYTAPNGDLLVAENLVISNEKTEQQTTASTARNNIMLYRDENGDGIPELKTVLLKDQDNTFGILIVGNYLYLCNANALVRYAYKTGQLSINSEPEQLASLPGKKRKWKDNIAVSSNPMAGFIVMGNAGSLQSYDSNKTSSSSYVPTGRKQTNTELLYQSLTQPLTSSWAPGTFMQWSSLNKRDEAGNIIDPQFLCSVKEGCFYGWNSTSNRDKDKNPALSSTITSVQPGYKLVFVPFKNAPVKVQQQELLTSL